MALIHKQTIYKALRNPTFAKEILPKLPLNAFDDVAEYKTIVSVINRYYTTNNEVLNESTLQTLIEDNLIKFKKSLDEQNQMLSVVHDLYTIDESDQNDEVIDDSIQKFVRKTLTAHMLMDVISKGSLEDSDTLDRIIEDTREISILNINGNTGEILDFFEDKDIKKKLLQNMSSDKFPTKFKGIDDVADGGLARGEMGLVIAPSGGGKTMWAVNQAANYVKSGMNVLYVPLEEKLDRMVLRLEQTVANQSKHNYLDNGKLNEGFYDAVQTAYSQNEELGRLFVVKKKPQEVTPAILEQIIVDVMIRKGVQLDAVIVDYPDLMKNPFEKMSINESRAGGMLFESLRGLAQEYQFVMWTLSQVNRTGFGAQVKTAEAIEGSKQKINACELVFTLNQTPEEFAEGYIRIYLDKVRNQSGRAFDKIVQFKVIPENGVIRDETSEEYMSHGALLATLGEDADNTRKKEKKTDVTINRQTAINSMHNINNALQGGLPPQ